MSAVLVGMMLGRFSRVVGSVLSVPVRYVSVVTGLLVISTLVVLGSFTMVFRRVLVMFSRLVMVLCSFVCHFGRLSMSSFAGQFHLSSKISILPWRHLFGLGSRKVELASKKYLRQLVMGS